MTIYRFHVFYAHDTFFSFFITGEMWQTILEAKKKRETQVLQIAKTETVVLDHEFTAHMVVSEREESAFTNPQLACLKKYGAAR
jgi:hypothetical protein